MWQQDTTGLVGSQRRERGSGGLGLAMCGERRGAPGCFAAAAICSLLCAEGPAQSLSLVPPVRLQDYGASIGCCVHPLTWDSRVLELGCSSCVVIHRVFDELSVGASEHAASENTAGAKEKRAMNTNVDTTKSIISDEERDAFVEALTLYYTQGPPITAAFAQVEAGLIDRYYRRKKKHPLEIERINREARAAAWWQRSGEELAFEAEQVRRSHEIQRDAMEALERALPELARIARGEPSYLWDPATGEERVVIVYPRDQIGAARLLQSIARGGVLPEGYESPEFAVPVVEETMVESREVDLSMLDLLGVTTAFSTLTARMPDGRTYTAGLEAGEVG